METKELKITPPDGYEIDRENSTFDCIKFKSKNKSLNYGDVASKLFFNDGYYITTDGNIQHDNPLMADYVDSNLATSKKQCEKLLAINILMNVAKYLNKDWKPDWSDEKQTKFCLGIDEHDDICVCDADNFNEGLVYFKCSEFAEQAIEILGNTIRLALSTDW